MTDRLEEAALLKQPGDLLVLSIKRVTRVGKIRRGQRTLESRGERRKEGDGAARPRNAHQCCVPFSRFEKQALLIQIVVSPALDQVVVDEFLDPWDWC